VHAQPPHLGGEQDPPPAVKCTLWADPPSWKNSPASSETGQSEEEEENETEERVEEEEEEIENLTEIIRRLERKHGGGRETETKRYPLYYRLVYNEVGFMEKIKEWSRQILPDPQTSVAIKNLFTGSEKGSSQSRTEKKGTNGQREKGTQSRPATGRHPPNLTGGWKL